MDKSIQKNKRKGIVNGKRIDLINFFLFFLLTFCFFLIYGDDQTNHLCFTNTTNNKKKKLQDTTFEFEKRRNVPVKYDRELVSTTIKAMKRVEEIKERRQKKFYEMRMAGKKQQEVKEGLAELEKNIDIIRAPESLRKAANQVEKVKVPKTKVVENEEDEMQEAPTKPSKKKKAGLKAATTTSQND